MGTAGEEALLTPIPGAALTSRSPDNERTHALEVNAIIENDELAIQWRFSSRLFRAVTIEALADSFGETLHALLEHCQGQESGFTPSDFPESGLSQEELDAFLEDFD